MDASAFPMAAVHLSSRCAEWRSLASGSSSFEDEDLQLNMIVDPVLDYINAILMEEGIADNVQQEQEQDCESYQAILNSFYEIIGEQSQPAKSCTDVPQEQAQDCESYQAILNSFYEIIGEQSRLAAESCITFEDQQMRPQYRINGSSADEQDVNDGFMINPDDVLNVTEIPTPPTVAGNFHGSYQNQVTNADLTVKLSDQELSYEDVKVKADYTALYVGDQYISFPDNKTSARNGKGNKVAGKCRKSKKESAKGIELFVDVKELLVSCAEAVAVGEMRRANEILRDLHQVHGVSPNGSGLQRTAYYFSKALVARMSGTGSQQFRAISNNSPASVATLLKASKLAYELCPYMKLLYYFANQSILKAAEGASRLNIVDYGLLYGMQWPCLINALADRKGGPPLLVITGIEFPQPGLNPALRLEESGQRLAAYARTHNVPFQYHAVTASKWEDLDPASLHIQQDEVLVVNCIKRLRHLADESIDLPSPREKLLTSMRTLNPHLLLTAIVNAAFNSTFFVSRFRDALYYYTNVFDMVDSMWGGNPQDHPHRLIAEISILYPEILNIVACEGAERQERPETYWQWQARIQRAGFEQLPLLPMVLSRSRSLVKKHYHKDFILHDDGKGWMLLGWKGRIVLTISAWQPAGTA